MRKNLGDCELCFPIRARAGYAEVELRAAHMEPIRNAAKLSGLKFHNLRHTAAVLLPKADVHPKIVRTGHASVVITLDTYSAWIRSLQAKAAEAMTAVFGRLTRHKKHLKPGIAIAAGHLPDIASIVKTKASQNVMFCKAFGTLRILDSNQRLTD
ncbi:MAG: hypothetical protein WB526_12250 [Candidatus Cybelea sp.]